MRKRLAFLCIVGIVSIIGAVFTGCARQAQEVQFEAEGPDAAGFHEIKVAEKVKDGVVFYQGDQAVYETDHGTVEIADGIRQLWREDTTLYYQREDALYQYRLDTLKEKKLVEKPHELLGKYQDQIISYSGRTIYGIRGEEKQKLFAEGYYLNSAALYGNKVYGIPASNVYAYDLDALETQKLTQKVEASRFLWIDDALYIATTERKGNKRNVIYSRVTDQGLEQEYKIKDVEWIAEETAVKGGIVVATEHSFQDTAKDNRLLYLHDGEVTEIDRDYSYEIIGVMDHKLYYYKNKYSYGTEQENLNTFYFYDGIKSEAAFDLDVSYYEVIEGYAYDGGLIIVVSYESSAELYCYDGERVKKLEQPDNLYHVIGIDIIDQKAYVRYSDGEESMENRGAIIEL